jgi:hypothetical protein
VKSAETRLTRSLALGFDPIAACAHVASRDAKLAAIIEQVAPWTVEMLLIFRLGPPDVLPVYDYGVRQGFKLAYRTRELPTPKDLARQGEKWRPFRTAASWYLWRAVDLARRAGRALASRT